MYFFQKVARGKRGRNSSPTWTVCFLMIWTLPTFWTEWNFILEMQVLGSFRVFAVKVFPGSQLTFCLSDFVSACCNAWSCTGHQWLKTCFLIWRKLMFTSVFEKVWSGSLGAHVLSVVEPHLFFSCVPICCNGNVWSQNLTSMKFSDG